MSENFVLEGGVARVAALGVRLVSGALACVAVSGCVALNLDWVAPEESTSDASTGAETTGATSTSSQGSGTSAGSTSDASAVTSAGASGSGVDLGETVTDDSGCVPLEVSLEHKAPDVMFVLDKSAPMGERSYPESEQNMGAEKNHWESVRFAVIQRASELEEVANFGAVLAPALGVPNEGADACLVAPAVEVSPMMPVVSALESQLPYVAEQMSGGRALGQAIVTARAALDESMGDGLQFMVLITNGAPNCDTQQDGADLFDEYNPLAESQILAARDEGVFTMVVGLSIEEQNVFAPGDAEPDISPWDALNELALAGGMVDMDDDPFFKDAATHEGLLKELDLVDDLVSCTARLPPAFSEYGPDEFYDAVEVSVDDEVLEPSPDCGEVDGFMVRQSAGATVLVACGDACDLLQSGGALHLSVECS